jgi:hypothetical protein
MSGLFSLAALVVVGIIVADIIKNPAGTKAASSGITTLVGGAESGLLGVAPKTS